MLAQVDIGNTYLGSGSQLTNLSNVGSFVSRIVQGSIAVAGIILVFLFVFGGISIIASAGSDNPQGVEKGKQAITTALLGFLLIFGAYWIVKLIEIIAGVTIL